jgi:hypothetical protein
MNVPQYGIICRIPVLSSIKRQSFLVTSHGNSNGDGIPSWIWHWAQLGWQSHQLHMLAALYL